MQQTDVRGLIDQAVELSRRATPRHGIELQTVVPDGLPMVVCREVQIEQVLVNLLNNAFDAIDGDARSQPGCRCASRCSQRPMQTAAWRRFAALLPCSSMCSMEAPAYRRRTARA